MRAIVVERPGGLEALALREVLAPAPGPDEVLIEVAYAGCNWSDVQKRQGVYPIRCHTRRSSASRSRGG